MTLQWLDPAVTCLVRRHRRPLSTADRVGPLEHAMPVGLGLDIRVMPQGHATACQVMPRQGHATACKFMPRPGQATACKVMPRQARSTACKVTPLRTAGSRHCSLKVAPLRTAWSRHCLQGHATAHGRVTPLCTARSRHARKGHTTALAAVSRLHSVGRFTGLHKPGLPSRLQWRRRHRNVWGMA